MGKVFYTADIHHGHRLVAGIRGFTKGGEPDPAAHDDFLADTWKSTVKSDDTVFVLGDISIGGKQSDLDWFDSLPGQKILISGNHDPVHPAHRDSFKLQRKWLEVFDSIQPFLRRKLEGHYFLLSHFPYAGTGAEGHGVEDRFTQYRLIDEGMALVHGHTHGTEKVHFSDNGTPQLHVGLDAWNGQLVSQDTVASFLLNPESSFWK